MENPDTAARFIAVLREHSLLEVEVCVVALDDEAGVGRRFAEGEFERVKNDTKDRRAVQLSVLKLEKFL